MTLSAVTWDFGQTLAELDTSFLADKLRSIGVAARGEALDVAVPAAWAAYDAAVRAGGSGHPWKLFMSHVLSGGGVSEAEIPRAVDFLWEDQPVRNLWRRPIAGMIEVVEAIAEAAVPQGIVSNSEGKLAELCAELGWARHFPVVADSGKLGVEKPATGIFRWAAERLGAPLSGIVHIGDVHAVDVDGAVAAGMHAIWFRGRPGEDSRAQVATCQSPDEIRAALRGWGLRI